MGHQILRAGAAALVVSALASPLTAQDRTRMTTPATEASLRSRVHGLADDAMLRRDTGQVGNVRAEPLARPARAQDDERAAVLAVVQRVFDGMRTRDTTLLLSAFDSTARLLGVRPRRGGGEVVQALPVRQFARMVAGDTRGVWLERIFNPEVRIDGTLASVWAPYDFLLAGTFSHCGVDAVHLLKVGGDWKIVALTDTYQPQGCPSRPPPHD